MAYYFMVGHESLNIDDIVIVSSPVGSGLVQNYDTQAEAIEALANQLAELRQKKS